MRFLIIILLTFIPLCTSGKAVQQERRALWVVRYALSTKKAADHIITTAKSLHITDIFVQVRARGEVFYDSRYEPVSALIQEPFDPFQYVLDQAKKTKIRVHAWVNMFYIWSGAEMPENQRHMINQRSAYILRNDVFPDYQSLRARGYEGFFVDPMVPQIRTDLLKILKELAERYDISGIHLDYFRYPGLAYSFTPSSRTQFMMDHLYDPWILYHTPQDYSQKYGYEVFLYADNEYRESLTEGITDFLQQISHTIKNIRPALELSVAVKPDYVQAKHRFFQDWMTWLKNRICDYVVIMNYRTKYDEFMMILRQLQEPQVMPMIIVGISTYNQDENSVIRRVRTVKSDNFSGYALFSYNHLFDHKNYLEKIRIELNAEEHGE